MAEKTVSSKVPEFLREPLEAAQARLATIEEEAQKVFKDLMQKGKDSRKDFAGLVRRLSRQDWNEELRAHVSKLREQGAERAQELRGRAESFRADALERLSEVQAKTVTFLGVATRAEVEELSRELEKLARRLDKSEKVRKARKAQAKRPAAEV
jgi:polyhydroxyalkanoate synthesis regulator phasin